MAEDFGDEAGQRLIDWSVRFAMYNAHIGGPAYGERTMREAADRLAHALEEARDSLRDPASAEVQTGTPVLPEWARLDLHEFQELDGYEEVRSAIDLKLASASIEHALYEEGGHAYLLFRSQDAPRVADCLDSLAGQARQAAEHAIEHIREQRQEIEESRDREPLEQRAQRARESAEAILGAEAPELDLSRGAQRREERPR